MHDLRAVVYGVGAMGSILTRLLLDKGVQIVGAVGRSPEKVGRDLGDVAGLGRKLDTVIDSDPHRVLAKGADIVVVCVSSYLSTMRNHFAVCLEHGANVITIEEETVYPWTTAPREAAGAGCARQGQWCDARRLRCPGCILAAPCRDPSGRVAQGRGGCRTLLMECRRLWARGRRSRPEWETHPRPLRDKRPSMDGPNSWLAPHSKPSSPSWNCPSRSYPQRFRRSLPMNRRYVGA